MVICLLVCNTLVSLPPNASHQWARRIGLMASYETRSPRSTACGCSMKRKSRENTSPDLAIITFSDDQPRFGSEPLGLVFGIFLDLHFLAFAALPNKLTRL